MIIKVLLDNVAGAGLQNEHGLSYYIETDNHKILFDMGESDIFYKNAVAMGIDLSEVDVAFVSHAHSDHGGGLKKFVEINTKAKVYMSEDAFTYTYSVEGEDSEYIGLDQGLKKSDRFIYTSKIGIIDDELEVFSSPTGKEFIPTSNEYLFMEKDDILTNDIFSHEQNLIVQENGKLYLFTGCAHSGIVNIIEEVKAIEERYPDVVLGGLHIGESGSGKKDPPERIIQLAQRLEGFPSRYFTGHCTGMSGYELLQSVLGDRIAYLNTGTTLVIEV